MTPPATLTTSEGATRIAAPLPPSLELGPLGRAGAWFVVHGRLVAVVWAVLVIGLGAFAPGVERALSGAGWEATGSQSVQVRNTVNQEFHGLSSYGLTVVLHDRTATAVDPVFQRVIARVQGILRHDPRVSTVTTPQAGASISRDGHTVLVMGGAGRNSNEMVRVADDLKVRSTPPAPAGCRCI